MFHFLKKHLTWLCLLLALPCAAQDMHVPIFQAASPIVTQQPWVLMNRTFIVRPIQPANTIYISVANLNASNSHTFTLVVSQTPDSQVADFTNNQGLWQTSNLNGSCSPVSASSTASCYLSVVHCAQLALTFSGITTQAGTDNVNVYIVQSPVAPPGPLGSATGTQNVQGTTANAASDTSTNPLLIAGDNAGTQRKIVVDSTGALAPSAANQTLSGNKSITQNYAFGSLGNDYFQEEVPFFVCGSAGFLCQGTIADLLWAYGGAFPSSNNTKAYFAQASATNPGAAADLLSVFNNAHNIAFKQVVLSTNIAAEIQIIDVNTVGTTCTAITPTAVALNVMGASNTVVNKACTTNPVTVRVLHDLFLAANSTITVDLVGATVNSGVAGGIEVLNVGAVTGIVSATASWGEI